MSSNHRTTQIGSRVLASPHYDIESNKRSVVVSSSRVSISGQYSLSSTMRCRHQQARLHIAQQVQIRDVRSPASGALRMQPLAPPTPLAFIHPGFQVAPMVVSATQAQPQQHIVSRGSFKRALLMHHPLPPTPLPLPRVVAVSLTHPATPYPQATIQATVSIRLLPSPSTCPLITPPSLLSDPCPVTS